MQTVYSLVTRMLAAVASLTAFAQENIRLDIPPLARGRGIR